MGLATREQGLTDARRALLDLHHGKIDGHVVLIPGPLERSSGGSAGKSK